MLTTKTVDQQKLYASRRIVVSGKFVYLTRILQAAKNGNFKSLPAQWGIEAFLPARIKLRYQASKLCFINAKARLQGGGSYSIHLGDPELNDFKTLELRRSDLNFSLEIEKGITDWIWASFEYGYRTNINFDVTNSNHAFSLSGGKLTSENKIIDSNAGGGLFYNLSVFLVPSKSILKTIVLKQNVE